MKKNLIAMVAILLMTNGVLAESDSAWRPNPQQASAIGSICQAWRQIAGGIYLLKSAGHPKPEAKSGLEQRVINEIYSPTSSIASQGMAEAMGEQFCIPVMKEKFRTGQLRVKG